MQETEESDGHFLRRWVSLGDVISLALSLTALGITYGQLSTELRHTGETVESLTRAMQELQGRDITPGARASLERVIAKDAAQDTQLTELRQEIRDQRREILVSLERLEDKLDDHMRGK